MRIIRVLALLIVPLISAVAVAVPAFAHEPGTTSVELQVGADHVTAQIDVQVDLLELALDTDLATDPLSLSSNRDLVASYLTDHLAFSDASGGQWTEAAGTLTAVKVDGVSVLRLVVVANPSNGGDVPAVFTFADDGILATDATHEIYVTSTGAKADTGLVGVIDDQTSELTVTTANLSTAGGITDAGSTLTSMVARGFDHVFSGADHLLFLLVLLLPAPLAMAAGRWKGDVSARSPVRKVVKIATSFTIGHSITLIASSLGWIAIPSGPVEILVAMSVAVAALHALRPLTATAEPLIAGGFGLIHGLAFSTLLNDLSLGRTTSLVSLLGFNIGIELAQLVFIAATFPSLWLLSRTTSYPAVRRGGAAVALVISSAWVVERIGVAANPLAGVEATAISHLPLAAALLAGCASLLWVRQSRADRTLAAELTVAR